MMSLALPSAVLDGAAAALNVARGWLVQNKDAILPLGVVAAYLTFLFNLLAERRRWRARVSARLIRNSISLVPIDRGDDLDIVLNQRARKPLNVRDEYEKESRYEYVFLVRNMSHRSTAIMRASVWDDSGSPVGSKADTQYEQLLGLPLVLQPWGVHRLNVRLFPGHGKRAHELILEAMDDTRVRVPLAGAAGAVGMMKWHRARLPRVQKARVRLRAWLVDPTWRGASHPSSRVARARPSSGAP